MKWKKKITRKILQLDKPSTGTDGSSTSSTNEPCRSTVSDELSWNNIDSPIKQKIFAQEVCPEDNIMSKSITISDITTNNKSIKSVNNVDTSGFLNVYSSCSNNTFNIYFNNYS